MLQRRNGARERRRGDEHSTDNCLLHRKTRHGGRVDLGRLLPWGPPLVTVMKLSPQPGLTPFEGSLISKVNVARRVCPVT
jgi:hypothetical protein